MVLLHSRAQPEVHIIEELKNFAPKDSVVASTDPQVLTLLPALSSLWTFVPLGDRTQASNEEILLRYLVARKLEGATVDEVERDFEKEFPSTKTDRQLSYVLFWNAISGTELTQKIRAIWQYLDLPIALSSRKLDFIITKSTPPSLSPAPGWKLDPIRSIGDWKLYALKRPIPVTPHSQ